MSFYVLFFTYENTYLYDKIEISNSYLLFTTLVLVITFPFLVLEDFN